jgi:lysylphosphatidylglycerol synthetase-like protein (DUF2156 family)
MWWKMTTTEVSTEFVQHAISTYTAAENPSAFLAMSEGNSYFTLPGRPGLVVYRRTGRYLVQFAGPFAPEESYGDLVAGFTRFAAGQGREVVAVQLQEYDAVRYADLGFSPAQIGASYAVDLDRFTLAGTRYMRLRNKISRALRNGLTVTEVDYDEWAGQVGEIDRMWLPLKGEGAKQLEFLVGQCGGPAQRHRRLFAGLIDGRMAGYILYSPVYGSRPGWMHDLSRRRPDLSPGIMEAINKTALETFRDEGERWLHFGFTPFTGLDDKWELPGASPAFRWFMRYLWEHGEAVYPAKTQLDYKEKWTQHLVVPEYAAFQGAASLPAFVHIFRACNAF